MEKSKLVFGKEGGIHIKRKRIFKVRRGGQLQYIYIYIYIFYFFEDAGEDCHSFWGVDSSWFGRIS